MTELFATFVFFFAVIDPIGTIPVFIAVTRGYDEKERRKIALEAAMFSAAVLLFFVVAGEAILSAIEVPLPAFRIAGGLVLFLFALSMIFGESKPDEEMKLAEDSTETAIFPLAVPSIAGPGAMLAAVMLTEKHHFSILEQALTTAMMLAVILVTLVFMLGASKIHNLIGNSGAIIVSRVMGLILTALAVTSVLAGISQYFGLNINPV